MKKLVCVVSLLLSINLVAMEGNPGQATPPATASHLPAQQVNKLALSVIFCSRFDPNLGSSLDREPAPCSSDFVSRINRFIDMQDLESHSNGFNVKVEEIFPYSGTCKSNIVFQKYFTDKAATKKFVLDTLSSYRCLPSDAGLPHPSPLQVEVILAYKEKGLCTIL